MGVGDDGNGGGLLRPKGVDPSTDGGDGRGLLTERGAVQPKGTVQVPVAPPADFGISLEKGASSEPRASAPPTSSVPIDRASIQETLESLRSPRSTFLELVFGRPAADLQRLPPGARLFSDRVLRIGAELAEADRDGGNLFPRNLFNAARKCFESARAELTAFGGEADLYAAAVSQLRNQQSNALVSAARIHSVDGKTLFGSDVLKLERDGYALGFSPTETRDIAIAASFTLVTTEQHDWVPCPELPDTPKTFADVARALLQHEAEGARALISGSISNWLLANQNKSAELGAQVAEQEVVARRPGSEALARHNVAWAFGVRELWWAGRAHASAEDFGRRWASGEISDSTVVQIAQRALLGAWFGMLGAPVLQARADAVGRSPNDRTALDQLRWSLGVPWNVGGEAFTDAATLADRIRTSQPVAQAALRAGTNGTLAAWLESLPSERGDATWQTALSDPQFKRHGSDCGFWIGVYRNAHDRSLQLTREDASETLTSWLPLRETTLAARYWDALKPLCATGELTAFLLNDPTHPLSLAQLAPLNPGESLDSSLNTLLWKLGATGLVVEWGKRDRAVKTPEDLAALYDEDPFNFEKELDKGYPFTWLQGRLGSKSPWALPLELARTRMGDRVSVGHRGAVVALCARKGGPMPFDPTTPARGQVTGLVAPGHPSGRDWNLLRPHLQSGLAIAWLLGQPHPAVQGGAQNVLTAWSTSGALPSPEDVINGILPYGVPAIPSLAAPAQNHPPTLLDPVPAPSPPSSARYLGFLSLAGLLAAGAWFGFRGNGPPISDGGGRPPDAAPPLPPPPPPPSVRCEVTGSATVFARSASVNHGATLSSHGELIGVGWVAPGRRGARGADDAAAAVIRLDGQLIQTLDPEVPDDTEYPEFNPRSVGRVTVRWSADGAPSMLSDEVTATPTDETVRCGATVVRWTVRRDGAAPMDLGVPEDLAGGATQVGAGSWTPELLQPFWCRTVNPSAPFVISQQLFVESDGAPRRRVSLTASPVDAMSPTPVTDFASSRTLISRIPTAPNPRRILKDRVADEWRATSADGSGYALVWREGEKIRGLWLDMAYRMIGGVWDIQTNDAHSAPEVRMQGSRGVLLFATRQQPVDGAPFRMAVVPLQFGTVPGPLQWLPVGVNDARTDHVAPSLAPLLGRGWLVAFTVRPRRDIATLPVEAQTDAVVVQGFDTQLRALTSPQRAMDRAHDAELVTVGQRFLLVGFAANGSSRASLSAAPGQCVGL